MLVETVRDFIDRDVKPTVREVEHANEYPEAWIEQMKQHRHLRPRDPRGVRRHRRCRRRATSLVTEELARGWMSLAGAMGGHTVVAKLLDAVRHRGAEAARTCRAMATGEVRATMALTEPGGGSDLQAMTTTVARPTATSLVVNGSKTWITNARRSGLIALLCKTDPAAAADAPGHLDPARRARARA